MIFLHKYICDNSVKESIVQHQKAWGLLKYVIDNYYNVSFDSLCVEKTDKGKPYFLNNNLKFNITHCKGMTACIVSYYNVGIDIENIRDFNPKIINKCFDDTEKNTVLQSADAKKSFFTYWTLKESYVKLLGDGLSHSLKKAVFYNENNIWHIRENEKYKFNSYIYDSYVISSCCDKECNENDVFKVVYVDFNEEREI